jgi:hypothetical protein
MLTPTPLDYDPGACERLIRAAHCIGGDGILR